MATTKSNSNLTNAKKAKNDEFYTLYDDIEKELKIYKDKFENKIVYCNCDDYTFSNFPKYFKDNFKEFKLKKLITTGLNAKYYEYDGENEIIKELEGNGDFRSAECIEFLKQADVVVTNPPFSLFREYVKQLMEFGKKFLVVGSMNAITYKEIFPYIKNNELWLGMTWIKEFIQPNKEIKKFGNICWFTNLDNKKHNEPIDLYRKYSNEYYPKYDNYDAIEVSKVSEIPMDYNGVMGVPITFLDKYCPTQFEIVDARDFAYNDKQKNKQTYLIKDKDGVINGKPTYARILIKRVF